MPRKCFSTKQIKLLTVLVKRWPNLNRDIIYFLLSRCACWFLDEMAPKGLKPFQSFSIFMFERAHTLDKPIVECVINWFQIVPLREFPWLFPLKHQTRIHFECSLLKCFAGIPVVAIFCLKFTFKLPFICVYSSHLRFECLSRRARISQAFTLISTEKVQLLSIWEFIQMREAKRHLIYSRMDFLFTFFSFNKMT